MWYRAYNCNSCFLLFISYSRPRFFSSDAPEPKQHSAGYFFSRPDTHPTPAHPTPVHSADDTESSTSSSLKVHLTLPYSTAPEPRRKSITPADLAADSARLAAQQHAETNERIPAGLSEHSNTMLRDKLIHGGIFLKYGQRGQPHYRCKTKDSDQSICLAFHTKKCFVTFSHLLVCLCSFLRFLFFSF